jgi:tRNA (mo5U34)-methyltransferase
MILPRWQRALLRLPGLRPLGVERRRLLAEREHLMAERDRILEELRAARSPGQTPASQTVAGTGAGEAGAVTATARPAAPARGLLFWDWLRQQVEAEPYWFQRLELDAGLVTPGWNDPRTEKLPYFGLPEDLTGKRVLDIGCSEGFFAFEAERRGAKEVVAIDSMPESIRRFNLCRTALGSRANAYLCNVYDLSPRTLGTFDLVLFYGVFYHLRHPQLALEKVLSVCTGVLLFQSFVEERAGLGQEPMGVFHPHGMMSGAKKEMWDPTVFWIFNGAGARALIEAVGFRSPETLSSHPNPFVVRAHSPVQALGQPPDPSAAPWS